MRSMRGIEENRGQTTAPTCDGGICCGSGRLTAIKSNQPFKSSI